MVELGGRHTSERSQARARPPTYQRSCTRGRIRRSYSSRTARGRVLVGRRQVGRRGVALCLLDVARPGDDRADPGLIDDPAQGMGRRRPVEQRGELLCRLDAGLEVDAGERLADVERLAVPVERAVVVGGERRVLRVATRQQSGRERDPGQDADTGLRGRRQHLLERLLPERVEDDLHRGDVRAGDGGQRLRDRLDAHPVRRDAAVGDHRVEGVVDLVAAVDLGRGAVQLDEVEPLDAEIAPRPVVPLAEVVEDVVLRDLLDPPAHLGGDEDPGVRTLAQEAPDDLLAAPVPVDVGGVEEGDARLDRGLEHGQRVAVGHIAPVAAELPGPQTDHRHLAAGTAERSLLHPVDPSHEAAGVIVPGRAPPRRAETPREAPRPGINPRAGSRRAAGR